LDDFLPILAEQLDNELVAPDGSALLNVDSAIAEQVREELTNCLAEVGFDEKYELSEEGRILEDLIDLFFVPKT